MGYDLIVVGGGPGGYPAALYAALRGLRVLLVEQDRLGGECTNYGCVPTKALLRAAAALQEVRRLGGSAGLPLERALEHARSVAEELSDGVGMLLRGRGVEVVRGRAVLEQPGRLRVEYSDGGVERLDAGAVLLAPGSRPAAPRGLEPDGSVVVDNRSVLRLSRSPGRVLVVGGGPVGVEYAQVLASFGAEVEVAEALERLLPGMSRDLSLYASRLLRRLGVRVRTRCPVEALERLEGGARARLCGEEREYDLVLVATGRRSRAREALADGMAERLLDDKGFIRTDPRGETPAPGVYAAGDATGPPMLAHKAIHESLTAAANIAGARAEKPPTRLVPRVVYGLVELAEVGYTSAGEAAAEGVEAREARIRLGGVTMAAIEGARDGFVKIVYEAGSGRLLGLVAAAPHASDLAGAAALAIASGATLEEAAEAVAAHPSMTEAILEAVYTALGRPLHYLR